MKTHIIAVVLLLCLSFHSYGQADSNYQALIAKASLFHLQKETKKALSLYEKAFQIQQPDALTAYKAAGAYSLDSNANQAFKYLNIAILSGWVEADWLSFDPYFAYLKTTHPDLWKKTEEQAFTNETQYANTLQFPALRKEINLMAMQDQKLRYTRIQSTDNALAQSINQQIIQSDLKNLSRAKNILQQYGWPTISQIGRDGQNNLWLIIQHADQDVLFQKFALQAMQKLKDAKDFNTENLAFLYDRVQCNLNYKQFYGTQVIWSANGEASAFRPIISEYNVDERRKKLGLQPLSIYALTYGFNYQKITRTKSKQKDIQYKSNIVNLIDSAKHFYALKEFAKTYDYYNTASTFIGGMSDEENFEASVLFSKIAIKNNVAKYRNMALDFLDLLNVRGSLKKSKLVNQPAFKVLYKEKRWTTINEQLLD